jgi:hypothetical protein
MRPKLLCAAAVAALLACVPAAGAAVKAGTFKGRTDRDQPVQFTVTKAGTLKSFAFRRVVLRCSDGERIQLGRVGSGRTPVTITPGGKFGFTVDYESGDTWSASGTIKGSRATGKLRFRVRFDSEGEPHPQGETICDSGKRRFAAELR